MLETLIPLILGALGLGTAGYGVKRHVQTKAEQARALAERHKLIARIGRSALRFIVGLIREGNFKRDIVEAWNQRVDQALEWVGIDISDEERHQLLGDVREELEAIAVRDLRSEFEKLRPALASMEHAFNEGAKKAMAAQRALIERSKRDQAAKAARAKGRAP